MTGSKIKSGATTISLLLNTVTITLIVFPLWQFVTLLHLFPNPKMVAIEISSIPPATYQDILLFSISTPLPCSDAMHVYPPKGILAPLGKCSPQVPLIHSPLESNLQLS